MKPVSVRHIRKAYGQVQALHDVSFDVEEGEIYGIIGADGAGKTTLFRILATLMLADEGTAAIEGMDVVTAFRSVRRIIGYMPGKFSLYPDLTVEENLHFFATVFGTTVRENYALIEDIYRQIEPFKHRRAGKLSGGMKQKLALSCALIHQPKVLLLDEPTTGVDPVSRKEFWEMLMKLKAHGITIVVSTPYMDEAKRCDRIALIQTGRFLQIDTPERIVSGFPDTRWAVSAEPMRRLLDDLRAFPHTSSSYSFGKNYHVTLKDPVPTDELAAFLSRRNYSGIEITPIRPSVEDCFIRMLHKEANA